MEALVFTNLVNRPEMFSTDKKALTKTVTGEVQAIVQRPVEAGDPFADVPEQSGSLEALEIGSVWKFRDIQKDKSVKAVSSNGRSWYVLVPANPDAAF